MFSSTFLSDKHNFWHSLITSSCWKPKIRATYIHWLPSICFSQLFQNTLFHLLHIYLKWLPGMGALLDLSFSVPPRVNTNAKKKFRISATSLSSPTAVKGLTTSLPAYYTWYLEVTLSILFACLWLFALRYPFYVH